MRRTLPLKEFYIRVSPTSARNAIDLGTLPELAQYLEPQFGIEVLLQTTSQHGVKE